LPSAHPLPLLVAAIRHRPARLNAIAFIG